MQKYRYRTASVVCIIAILLSLYTTVGASATKVKPAGQKGRLKKIENMMSIVFHKPGTSHEQDLQKFIKEHGGNNVCISNNKSLEVCITKNSLFVKYCWQSLASIELFALNLKTVEK